MASFAAVFPGQGSQHPGMGKELYDNFAAAKRVYEEASDSIKYNLTKLCFEGSDADLRLTANTQPALLVTSMAAWEVFKSESGLKPTVGLGHSLGEYSALASASALTLADAIKAVRLRGQAMQDAVPVGTGTMFALLGMEDEAVMRACHDLQLKAQTDGGLKGCVLEAANFNCPGQVVISGHTKALEYFKANLVAADYGATKAKLLPLTVSAPFHCSLMMPAAEKLKTFLDTVKWKSEFDFDIVHNATSAKNKSSQTVVKVLFDQMTKPVLWTSSVRKSEMNTFVEFGAGRVLSGLVKKIIDPVTTLNVDTVENLKLTMSKLNEA
jgi:[acyl-carrier-protein] S-malonyltransferase